MITRHTLTALLLLVAIAATAACVDDPAPTQSSATGSTDYPPAPYGVEIGAIIEDLGFEDQSSATTSLSDLRRTERPSTLLVVTGVGWCSSCRRVHKKMQALHEQHPDLTVVLAMQEDGAYATPDAAFLASFADHNDLTFHVLADPDRQLSAYFEGEGTSRGLIIDAESMEIREAFEVFDAAMVDDAIGGAPM